MQQNDNYSTVIGDLLESKEDAIVQQCNCVTTYPKGLSKAIFKKWPYSDDYTGRNSDNRPKPGSVSIKENNQVQQSKIIVNMFAQYYPSKPKYANDSAQKRKKWFQQ